MSRREEAKDERKQRIIDAARQLIRSENSTGFSMRQLAIKADVSLVTPYNLFGSKQTIMQRLLDEDIGAFALDVNTGDYDPIERFFHAVRLSRIYFERDEPFYRTIINAVYSNADSDIRAVYRTPRRALWRSLVDAAMASGHLFNTPHAAALTNQLSGTSLFNLLAWTHGSISIDTMEQYTQYGFALTLAGHVTPQHASRMREKIDAALEALASSDGRESTSDSAFPDLAGAPRSVDQRSR